MEFVPMVALLLLIKKFVDFLRMVSGRDFSGIVTQLVVWSSGVGALFLAAQTQWAEGISIGDRPLSHLTAWSIVFVGLTLGSTASVVSDFTKAVDNSDSAKRPPL